MSDEMIFKFKIFVEDDEAYDDEEEVEIPGKYEVCDRCHGTGVHDHEAFSNGISMQDFDEDPDFRHDYMRGRYEVPCSECGGKRVVLVPHEDCLTAEQKKKLNIYYEKLRDEADWRREEEMERRMGA